MAQAKEGDSVTVHYTGSFDDGQIFDSSQDRDPLAFTLGAGQVIAGFEQAVIGMIQGESKRVKIAAEDAYGDVCQEMIITVDRNQFPEGFDPELGQMLRLKRQDGQPIEVTVTAITDRGITLDANHPMAGKNLNFEIHLMEIV